MIDASVLDKNTLIHLKENESKVIYQNLNNPIDNLNISLEDNSNLEIMLYNSCCNVSATLNENAYLTIYNISFSNNDYVVNMNVDINGSNSNVLIINVYLGIKDSNIVSNIMINHNEKNSVSLFETYAIAKDNAKLVLNNNAKIKAGMSHSDARQMTKGLNLSPNASIKAQPNLFIDEYDVVASHSCSIGSIDKDDLFYLMSRGLSETQAQEIVILGFIQPILANIKNEELQKDIYNNFANFLK